MCTPPTGIYVLHPSPFTNTVITSSGSDNHTITTDSSGNKITLGDGKNIISLGFGSVSNVVILGNGNNTINYGGSGGSTFKLGNGNNIINDTSGRNDDFTVGNGNNIITTTGQVTAGSGNNKITATGNGEIINVHANAKSVDTVKINSNSILNISGGKDQITITGTSDTVHANALIAGSTINYQPGGDIYNEMLFIGSNSSAVIHLKPSIHDWMQDKITIQALGADNKYTGNVEISGFGSTDHINLDGLGFKSFADVKAATTFAGGKDTVALQGGGHIIFDSTNAFTASHFSFATTHGVA